MPKRLLVADDSATIQKVVQYCLGQEDVEIVQARSAEEAYGKVRELRPDLLITDTVMTGKSGYDLARALKNDAAMGQMPILLLASANEPFDENKAKASGADAWLPKPFQSQALIEQVRKLLSGAPARTQPPAARPAQPPPARPQPAAAGPRPGATQPPPARPAAPPTRPPPPRPPGAATMPPTARPPAGTRPPPPRPGAAPATATRPPPPRPPGGATMPPAARPPTAAPPARPQPPTPGPVAAGRGPAPAAAPAPTAVTADNHEALLREALTKATRDMIEKIAWEVVPELAETIIREELERLIKARQGQ